MKTSVINDLQGVTLEQARAYLADATGDELEAAYELAADRNRLEGIDETPGDMEVHHALFLLRRARGLEAPSYDSLRIALREREREKAA